MRTPTSKSMRDNNPSKEPSSSKQSIKIEDNRPENSIQRKLQSLISGPTSSQEVVQRITAVRSAQVVQRTYKWSDIGEDGVLIGDAEEPYVIKFGGYDDLAVPMDQLGEQFGFTPTNARIVRDGDQFWDNVVAAKEEAGGGWNRDKNAAPKDQALVMERLQGVPLHLTEDTITAQKPAEPTELELGKITNLCRDLGKMLVMDLVSRNNDRFNLTDFDEDLLSTNAEKTPDADNWRRWMANEGNILVDQVSGAANPIDSQFTEASNEEQYARNIASLLVNRKNELVESGMKVFSHNWSEQDYAKNAFRSGIDNGIAILLNL